MDKSRLFFGVVFFLFFVVAGISFVRYFILRDYLVQAEISCDPSAESCFVYTCDPIDDSECPEAEDERTSYYKLIQKKAFTLPDCEPGSEGCPELECVEGEDCQVILCDQETEECSQPESTENNLFE